MMSNGNANRFGRSMERMFAAHKMLSLEAETAVFEFSRTPLPLGMLDERREIEDELAAIRDRICEIYGRMRAVSEVSCRMRAVTKMMDRM